MDDQGRAWAINDLDIDPKIRRYEKEIEELDRVELICTLYLKGWRTKQPFLSLEKLKDALHEIERGEHPDDEQFVPMSTRRYLMVEQLIVLKEAGMVISTSIPEEHIMEAYRCLKDGQPVPEDNLCLPKAFKEKDTAPTTNITDVVEYQKSGFASEEEFTTMRAIYHASVIQRIPKNQLVKKYGVTRYEVDKAVSKVRDFITNKFVPQEVLSDALNECRSNLSELYDLQEKAIGTLDYFDEKTDEQYNEFIEQYETIHGSPKIVLRGIAKERQGLNKTILEIKKSIAEERKRELELQGLIGQPVNLLQLNIYNSQQEKDDILLASALSPANATNSMDGSGALSVSQSVAEVDYEKYMAYLSPEDQEEFMRLMQKVSELYFQDLDGELKELKTDDKKGY